MRRLSDEKLPCLKDNNMQVRTIALSTLCFVRHVGMDSFTKRYSPTFFRACYSFHSSLSEIRDMVQYLKPEQAFANVAPNNQIQKTLDSFVKSSSSINSGSDSTPQFKFGSLKKTRKRHRKKSYEGESFDSNPFGESPVSTKKTTLNTAVPTPAKKPRRLFESPSGDETFPALFASSFDSDGDENPHTSCSLLHNQPSSSSPSSLSDTDMFDNDSWIKENRSEISSQDVEEFGEMCSLRLDDDIDNDAHDCVPTSTIKVLSQGSNQSTHSPSLIKSKKLIDLTLSSDADSQSQPGVIDIISSSDS